MLENQSDLNYENIIVILNEIRHLAIEGYA